MTFGQAAATPISGVTALQAARKAGVGRDTRADHRRVGRVGTFAVQIAKGRGAKVAGMCSTAKIELVRSFGAEHVHRLQAR